MLILSMAVIVFSLAWLLGTCIDRMLTDERPEEKKEDA
jgi:hypothetical protein